MTPDLQALLAAVVADPSDDVARLVYADCLEEHGNAPRAQFIRLQIEAERHHPDSSARAMLEQQAEALFAEHWVEWWGEVCAAVGLPMPAPKPGGVLGRLASHVGLSHALGAPYHKAGLSVRTKTAWDDSGMGRWDVTFRRGFPDTINRGGPRVLPAWFRASPLSSLSLRSPIGVRFDPADLRTVRELKLGGRDLLGLTHALRVAFDRLESLSIEVAGGYDEYDHLMTTFVEDYAEMLTALQVRPLKRLAVPIWSSSTAEVIAGASNLAGLEALDVSLNDGGEAAGPLAVLAASPHLANLKELSVAGVIDVNRVAPLARAWKGIRRLELRLPANARLDPLAGFDGLPELEELRLLGVHLDGANVAALSRSPLLKRVRHFALEGGPIDGTTLPKLVAALDRDRIETFALILPPQEPLREYAAELLSRWFGDRARVRFG